MHFFSVPFPCIFVTVTLVLDGYLDASISRLRDGDAHALVLPRFAVACGRARGETVQAITRVYSVLSSSNSN